MMDARILDDHEPIKQFALHLAAMAAQLAQALSSGPAGSRADPANENDASVLLPRSLPEDPMTLEEVKFELRLKEKQIVTLRRLWGFPVPCHNGGHLLFSRREVQRWASLQPVPENLAAVLRLRRRDRRGDG